MRELPADFDFFEAGLIPFSGRREHMERSALWVHETSDELLAQFDAIPIGAVELVLATALRNVKSAASDVAKVALFRPGSNELRSAHALSSDRVDFPRASL